MKIASKKAGEELIEYKEKATHFNSLAANKREV
jgi:hypothetical protein